MKNKYTLTDTLEYMQARLRRLVSKLEDDLDTLESTKEYLLSTVESTESPQKDFYSERLLECENRIKSTKAKLSRHKNLQVDSVVYGFVVNNYITKMVDTVIKEAYTFNLGHKLGLVKIIKKVRTKRRVDWNASMKNKQSLLDAGKKLWDKDTETGIKWIIYHKDKYDYSFRWLRVARNFKYSYAWYFKFTTGPNGVQTKALKYFRQNPVVTLKHKLYEKRKN